MFYPRSTLFLVLTFGLAFAHGDEMDYEASSFGGSMGNVLEALREEAEERHLIPDDFYSVRDWASAMKEVANVIDEEVYPGFNSIDARSGRQVDAEEPQDPLEGSIFRPIINFLPSVASALRNGSLFLMAVTEFLEDIGRSLNEQRILDVPETGVSIVEAS